VPESVFTVPLETIVLLLTRARAEAETDNAPGVVRVLTGLCAAAVEEKLDRLKGKYVSLFLLFTYAILATVCSTIVQMFGCVNVDPDFIDGKDGQWFLVADKSISCDSPRYVFGASWAAFMLLLYPIGIPLLYFGQTRMIFSE